MKERENIQEKSQRAKYKVVGLRRLQKYYYCVLGVMMTMMMIVT